MSGLVLQPIAHQEGIDFLKDKPAVTRAVFDQLIPELKGLAFTITGVQAADTLQNARDILTGIPAGRRWEDVKAELLGEISPFIRNPNADADEAEAHASAANRRADLLMRTHGFGAYEVAHSKVLEGMGDVFTYWRWQTMGDDKVRAAHAAMNGITLPRDSSFWRTVWPNRGWNCRCMIVGITPEEAEEEMPADEQLLPEKRKYPQGPALHQLEHGILNRGPSEQYNLLAEPGPHRVFGSVRPSLEDLRDRYDPDVWQQFEAFAKGQEIEKGRTVWGWLNEVHPLAAVPAKPAGPAEFPDSLVGLKVIKTLGGSTGAQLVEDADGNQWVMKKGASPDHLREEVTADQLYQALGVDVPEAKLYEHEGKPVKLARFIKGQTLADYLAQASAAERQTVIEKLQQGFSADVLLGNWDVVGLSKDNIIVGADGKPWRIDNGGSLRYRAMGTPKTADQWHQYPTELWSLRDKTANPQTAEVFSSLRLVQAARSMEHLQVPDLPHLDPVLKSTLEARAAQMRSIATKSLDMEHDGWRDSYTDDLCRHIIGLRQAGISTALPTHLNQPVNGVDVVDEHGKPWDDLRTSKGHASTAAPAVAAPALVKGDVYWQPILDAAKSLNHHVGTSAYNKTKVDAALAMKGTLQTLAAGKGQKAAMAKQYVQQLKWIETAAAASQAGTKWMVPQLTPYKPKTKAKPTVAPAKPSAGGSLVQRLAAYIQANGGDYAAIIAWKGNQAGDSWNPAAQAKKAWVGRHLNIAASKVWWKKGDAEAAKFLSAMEGSLGAAKVDAAFTIHHAFVQELLASTDMRHNDRQARAIRLVRTEQLPVLNAYGAKGGQVNHVPRGLCESSSPFKVTNALANTYEGTVQAVPHSKVLGCYIMERTPGAGDCGFLSNNENEFTFAAADTPFLWSGDTRKITIDMNAGNDAHHWGLPLSHLRP